MRGPQNDAGVNISNIFYDTENFNSMNREILVLKV